MRVTKEKAEITRKNILKAALELFSENSYSEVSVNSIAARAGVTKGAVYGHFSCKEDVLLQLIRDFCNTTEQEYYSHLISEKEALSMKKLYAGIIAIATEDSDYKMGFNLMKKSSEWPDDVKTSAAVLHKDSMEREMQLVVGYIMRSQQDGIIRKDVSPQKLAVIITSSLRALIIMLLNNLLPSETPEYSDFIFTAFERTLTPLKL